MTRQLLTRLSQEERTVAVILLGYPERINDGILPIEWLLTGLLQFPGNYSLSQNYQRNRLESRMSYFSRSI